MRHVETDPSRQAREPDPSDGPCSSAAHHLGVQHDPLVTDHPAFWQLGNTPFEREAAYGLLLSEPLDASVGERLEHAMSRGWAIGSERFLAELAGRLSRPVRPRPPGRPPRARTSPTPARPGRCR
jgi:putative transposase